MATIREKLNADAQRNAGDRRPGIRFVEPTKPVIAGLDLTESGDQSYGSVHVSTGRAPTIDPGELRTGTTISVGATEGFPGCELRVARERDTISIGVFDTHNEPLTRSLRCTATDADEYDEGLFAWIGPAEEIHTAWSDNDPAQCQVVTVDDLREFAGGYAAGDSIEVVLGKMADALRDSLPEERHGDFDSSCAELLPEGMRGWYAALLGVGGKLNRRITPDPAAFCNTLFSVYGEGLTAMQAAGEHDTRESLEQARLAIAIDFLKAGYRSKELGPPMVTLLGCIGDWPTN